MYEVVVVGGGPAGAATATQLARRGRKVALLERSHLPRRKPCGEGLLPPGVAALEDLGVLDDVAGVPLRAITFHAGASTATAFFRGTSALGVERTHLDQMLLDNARTSGVDVREGVTVRALERGPSGEPSALMTDYGLEPARVIVAADGLHSRLRRQADLDKPARSQRYAVAAHFDVPEAREIIEIIVLKGCEVYVTPVRADRLNVTCLGDRSLIRALAANSWAGFASLVRETLRMQIQLCDEPIATGPFPAHARRAYRGRMVLVGDAAGFFDGISGEGISLALQNAKDCAAAVDEALRTNRTDPFAGYDRVVRERARSSTLLAKLSLFLASHPLLGETAVRNLKRHPSMFGKLVAINSGEAGLSALRPSDVASLLDPRALVRRRTEEDAPSVRSARDIPEAAATRLPHPGYGSPAGPRLRGPEEGRAARVRRRAEEPPAPR